MLIWQKIKDGAMLSALKHKPNVFRASFSYRYKWQLRVGERESEQEQIATSARERARAASAMRWVCVSDTC